MKRFNFLTFILFSANISLLSSVYANDTLFRKEKIYFSNEINQIGNGTFSKRDELSELNLYRYFLDVNIFGVSEYLYSLSTQQRGYSVTYPGVSVTLGNNWYLTKNRTRFLFKLIWFKLGVCMADGFMLTYAPLNVGLGHNFKILDNLNLELSLMGGAIFHGKSTYGNASEVDYALYPRFKVIFKKMFLSFEFSTQSEEGYYPPKYNYYHVGVGWLR